MTGLRGLRGVFVFKTPQRKGNFTAGHRWYTAVITSIENTNLFLIFSYLDFNGSNPSHRQGNVTIKNSKTLEQLMHGQIQDLLVSHKFYSSILLSFIFLILLPFLFSSFFVFSAFGSISLQCLASQRLNLPTWSKHEAFRNFWGWPRKNEMRITYTSDTDSLNFWLLLHIMCGYQCDK